MKRKYFVPYASFIFILVVVLIVETTLEAHPEYKYGQPLPKELQLTNPIGGIQRLILFADSNCNPEKVKKGCLEEDFKETWRHLF